MVPNAVITIITKPAFIGTTAGSIKSREAKTVLNNLVFLKVNNKRIKEQGVEGVFKFS